MPAFDFLPESYSSLKDKVVVLTGGAHGIGECTVTALHSAGAHIFIGDWDLAACEAVVKGLEEKDPSSTSMVDCLKIDVRDYQQNIALFKAALEKHGRIDHAICIAGVTEKPGENWFGQALDTKSVEQPPSTLIVDVNMTAMLYFTRIASAYLRAGNEDRSLDKSIVIMGSVASFKEQAGLFVYQPTKHGVLGLIRSSRKYFKEHLGIRLNTVCPSCTITRMAAPIADLWRQHGVEPNRPEAIADAVLTLTATTETPTHGSMAGLAVFVEADKGWEIEKDLDRCDAQWLGEKMSKNAAAIDKALGTGSAWVDPK